MRMCGSVCNPLTLYRREIKSENYSIGAVGIALRSGTHSPAISTRVIGARHNGNNAQLIDLTISIGISYHQKRLGDETPRGGARRAIVANNQKSAATITHRRGVKLCIAEARGFVERDVSRSLRADLRRSHRAADVKERRHRHIVRQPISARETPAGSRGNNLSASNGAASSAATRNSEKCADVSGAEARQKQAI